MAKTKEEKESKPKIKSVIERYGEKHKEDHYNGIQDFTYKYSSGSIKLDAALDGGYGPGIIRKSGSSEGGKSASTLEEAANFLEVVPRSKVLYIKAEGRLSEKMKARCGIKFTEDFSKWDVGTCLVLKSNIFDSLAQLIFDLVTDNPEDFKFLIVIDSMDGLILKADVKKSFDGDESVKVAGPQVLTKRLLKQVGLPIATFGHVLVLIAQVSAHIAPKYDVKDQLSVGGSGGNAQIHFSNISMEYRPRNKSDYITKNGEKEVKLDFETNNTIGHWCKVTIRKSENESTGLTVRYPVKYKVKNGSAIWSELEVRGMLISYGLLTVKKAANEFSPYFVEEMRARGLDFPDKVNGENKCNVFLARPDIFPTIKKYLNEFASNDEIDLSSDEEIEIQEEENL